MKERDLKYLRETIRIAQESREAGNHPFGSTLVGPNGEVLIRTGNSYQEDKGVGHAELNVARQASRLYDPEFLAKCTLYTSVEPCCMCAGACYWAGIGAVVYGITEKRPAVLTGDNPENLTLNLSCETVFSAGRRTVETRGPYSELRTKSPRVTRAFGNRGRSADRKGEIGGFRKTDRLFSMSVLSRAADIGFLKRED